MLNPPPSDDIDTNSFAYKQWFYMLWTSVSTTVVSAANSFIQLGAGAVIRTIQDKAREMASFEDFGAIGDGVADDTIAIQAALNTGYNLYSNSKRKIYKITNTLFVKPITTYQNIDFRFSELKLNDPTGLKSHIQVGDGITQTVGVSIWQCVFTRVQVATAGAAIFATYVGLLEIYRCRIYGNSFIYQGVNILRGIICLIDKNYIQNTVQNGIYLEGTGAGANKTIDITITKNRIEYCGGAGLTTWDYVEGIFCRGNIFFATTGAAVALNASAAIAAGASFKFEGNDYDTIGGSTAFYINRVSNIAIAESWFSNNAGIANLIIDVNCSGVVVNGGQIYNLSGGIGVQIYGTDVNVNGLLIANGNTGVDIKPAAARVFIDGNVIENCNNYAIDTTTVPAGPIKIGENAFFNCANGGSSGIVSPSVASVATLPLLGDSKIYTVTGAVNIGQISQGYAGRQVTLIFAGALTVFQTAYPGGFSSIVLNGAANFTTAAGNTLTLIHNGITWIEIARKV